MIHIILLYIMCVDVLPPTNVTAIVATSRSIQITWEPSSSPNITGYLISYTTTAPYVSSSDRSKSITVTTTSGTLTNLEEDTLYTITVQTTTSDNRISANSNEMSVRTYTDGK